MAQVLDYSEVCGYCSQSMTEPAGGGIGAPCAYLHTREGRREAVSAPVADTPADTDMGADTSGADTSEPVDTNADTVDSSTTKAQQVKQWRLDNPEAYQAQKDRARDRRNGLSP